MHIIHNYIKIQVLLFLFFIGTLGTFAQKNLQNIGLDSTVIIGQLENGLTYFIKENKKPAQTVELRLVIKTGSIVETEKQLGLAHFCEHMSFNGSEHFPGNKMISTLEKMGVQFGADLNASTGFDQTIYQIEVPVNQKENLDTAFLILSDWADRLNFNPTEIDKERGVIMSEWRSSKGPSNRLRETLIPKIFYNSHYADRLPIGDTLVIQNFERNTIVSYYNDWYRPNLMGVFVVGDIDAKRVEKLIHQHFGSISNPPNAPDRLTYNIPDHDTTFLVTQLDPEITEASFSLMFKETKTHGFSLEKYRQQTLDRLFISMVNSRLTDITRSANPPFRSANLSIGAMNYQLNLRSISFHPIDNDYLKSIKAIEQELARIKQYGFLETETKRAIRELITNKERSLKNIEERKSSVYVNQYINSWLSEEDLLDETEKLSTLKDICQDISNTDFINEISPLWEKVKNRVILIEAPEDTKSSIPEHNELLQILDHSDFSDLKPLKDELAGKTFFDETLQKATLKNERYIKKYDITELLLSNGVKVVLKPTDFSSDYIQFRALSPGGSSQLPDSSYLASVLTQTLVHNSGIGSYNRSDLNKFLTGKRVKVIPGINTYNEGMVGSSDNANFELMMQMIYLYFTQNREDSLAFQRIQRELLVKYENAAADPNVFFSDTCNQILYNNHPRKISIPSQSSIAKLKMENLYSIYRDRFADASDFTFIFVGDLNDSLKSTMIKYLGALPSINRKESIIDVSAPITTGAKTHSIHKGTDQEISSVKIYFDRKKETKTIDEIAYDAAERLVEMALLKTLREEMGQIYSVSVKGQSVKIPSPKFLSKIAFRCSPQNADSLVITVKKVIKGITADAIEQVDLDKIKMQMLQKHQKQQASNLYWISLLKDHYESNTTIKHLTDKEKQIKKLNKKKLADAVQIYFNPTEAISFILYPEQYNSIK